jgi:putative heme-binding domain-containing protein
LASSLQSLDGDEWWQLASLLLSESELASDRYYPLQVWYGIESHVGQSPDKAIELLKTCKLPEVSSFIVRRVTLGVDQWAEPLDQMLSWSALQPNLSQLSNPIIQGLIDGTAGRADAPQLKHWPSFFEALNKSNDDNLKQQAMQLNILFNKGRGEEELLAMVNDTSKQLAWRRQAILALARQKSSKLREKLIKAIDERDMAPSAIDALGIVGSPEDSEMLVARFSGFNQPAREAVVRLLASRPSTAPLLLNAVAENKFPRSLIQTTTLRQLQYLGNDDINKRLIALFPETAQVSEDKRKRIVDLQEQLSKTDGAAGNPVAGRKLFDQSCAKCHRLFGEGSQIGPELTGSQRSNLNYLLDNIVDPSAQLADTYRMSVIRLEDGRVIMGVILQQNDKVLTLQTADDRLALSVADIEEIQRTNKSLMPEGLLDSLTQQQIRDLVSYLQSSRQVALTKQEE